MATPTPIGLDSYIINVPKATRYEFQVVEYYKKDKVVKVELQSRTLKYDQLGTLDTDSGWVPIPRIKVDVSVDDTV